VTAAGEEQLQLSKTGDGKLATVVASSCDHGPYIVHCALSELFSEAASRSISDLFRKMDFVLQFKRMFFCLISIIFS